MFYVLGFCYIFVFNVNYFFFFNGISGGFFFWEDGRKLRWEGCGVEWYGGCY